MHCKSYLEKKSNNKNQKTAKKFKVKKPLVRKQISVQTPFSHSTFKFEWKISHLKTIRFFAPLTDSAWLKSLLQFDFKNRQNVWTDL